MAKTLARIYTFTPGAANVGTIVIPGRVQLEQLLVITNTTKNIVIYNFADPTYAGTTAVFTTGNTAATPKLTQRVDGYTTITLAYNTTGMTGDSLQILFEETQNGVKFIPQDETLSHDNIFHSMLDCANIRSSIIDKNLSICSKVI